MAVKTNLGKESICIDLKKPEGQAILHELVATADVVVHNFRGEVPTKLGIGYRQLPAINPESDLGRRERLRAPRPGRDNGRRPIRSWVPAPAAWPCRPVEALTRDCPTLADVRETLASDHGRERSQS